jgi:hypothetical protein
MPRFELGARIDGMTMHPLSPDSSLEPVRWKPVVSETVMSLLALLSIGGLFFNALSAYLTFFGEPVVVTPTHVRWYHFFVGLLIVSVIGSFAASIWRGGTKSRIWHTFIALIGLAAAVVFSVSLEEPGQDDPPRAPSVGCHSGGDSEDCPGG